MDDVVCEEDEDDDEMLVVVWWMTEQMLGVAAHTSAAGAWRRRADVTKMYMCLPLHFVATLLHLVALLAAAMMRSQFTVPRTRQDKMTYYRSAPLIHRSAPLIHRSAPLI